MLGVRRAAAARGWRTFGLSAGTVAGQATRSASTHPTHLVSAANLAAELEQPAPPRIIDATWFLPNSGFAQPDGQPRDGVFRTARIPTAAFWDADADSDPTFSTAPHNLPLPRPFAARMAELGVTAAGPVVVYDQHGIFSSPRLWYTLRAYGHSNVRVLDGGLPGWIAAGLALDTALGSSPASPSADAAGKAGQGDAGRDQEVLAGGGWVFNPSMQWSKAQMLDNLEPTGERVQVVDARSAGRFHGTEPEPREGMRGGHMPHALSVPFSVLLATTNGVTTLRPRAELRSIFAEAGVDLTRPVVTSCGSGMTACVLSLGLLEAGARDVSVYDGSWTEWGGCSDTPIVAAGADGGVVAVP